MHTQHLHVPTQIASTTCLYLSLGLKSWIQKPSLCLSASLQDLQHQSAVVTGGTHLAGPLHKHCCGCTWKSPAQLRARKQLILWSCSSWHSAWVPPVTLGVDILEISVELILIHRAMDPISNNSHIQGSFIRLWDREGFILIRDALLHSLWPLGAFSQTWEGGKLAKSECWDLE